MASGVGASAELSTKVASILANISSIALLRRHIYAAAIQIMTKSTLKIVVYTIGPAAEENEQS